jgi:hypothetical protein
VTHDRRRLALLAVSLVILGVGTKTWGGPASDWVRNSTGGTVYVAFWCVLVLIAWPRASATAVAAWVFLTTCALEFLQLWNPPLLAAARRTLAGQAVLGATFSWSDFPYYVLGAVAAVALVRMARAAEP